MACRFDGHAWLLTKAPPPAPPYCLNMVYYGSKNSKTGTTWKPKPPLQKQPFIHRWVTSLPLEQNEWWWLHRLCKVSLDHSSPQCRSSINSPTKKEVINFTSQTDTVCENQILSNHFVVVDSSFSRSGYLEKKGSLSRRRDGGKAFYWSDSFSQVKTFRESMGKEFPKPKYKSPQM